MNEWMDGWMDEWMNDWMNEWMVISIVLVRAVTRDLRSRRDWVRYLLSPILPFFIKRCYDKKLQEGIWLFLYDFLKSSNKILSSVTLKNVRCLRLWGMESFKYHITGKVFVLTRIGLAKFNFFAIISIHS